MKLASLMVVLISLFLNAAPCWPQTVDASVRGQVTDSSGGVVGGARITMTNRDTGLSRATETNERGHYALPALPAGVWELQAQMPGFKTLRQTGIVLAVGEEARRDLVLQVGELREELTVTAELQLIEAETAAVGVVIPNNYIANLPLDGRNFLELALLAPGASPNAEGSAGSERGRLAFHANGSREDSNAYIYDGVYAVDPVLNSFTFTPPVDAVQEFRIHTSNAESGFGRHSGSQVAVVLKQGTNQIHGTVYEFFRNDALDARNFFSNPDQPAPKLRRNQFGFSLGGPVRSNTSFFFVDYEGLRERRAVTRTTNVPTAAERAGDFSNSALPPPIDPFSGQPFPGNRLPFLHPVGEGVANLYPLPNRPVPGQNFLAAPTGSDESNKFDVRIDQALGRNGTLNARYSFSDRERFEPYAAAGFADVPGYGNDVPERGQNLMLGETHSLTPRWVNEFRFGYNRVSSGAFHENLGTSVNQTVGLPDFATRPRDLGLSFINVTGFSSLGDEFNNPQDSTVNSYQILDNVSYAQGSHLVQMGFEQRWIRQDAFRDVQSRGQLNFTNSAFTGNALADLLLGLPTFTGGAVSDNPQALRAGATNVFIEDGWRARGDLTVNLGLRYEYNTPPYDAFDAASVYNPATQSIARVGANGIPRAGFHADKNNFAPRIGLAWSPFGSRTFVLRSGYGIYYNAQALAPGQGIYFNPPFFNFQLFFPTPQAPISLQDPWPADLQAAVPPSAFTYDRNLRTSYTQQWNFNAQADLGHGLVFDAGYFGAKGTRLIGARDINQPAPSPQMPNLRPVPFFLDINQIESSFSSTYHSFQTKLQCRLRGGLTGLFSYTWSKSIDNASNFFPSAVDPNFPQDSHNVAAERGLSSFDARHRFAGSFVYELPFGEGKRLGGNLEGWRKSLASGWQMNSIMTFQSGQPFTVALPGELDNSNTGQSLLGFGAGDRPNVIGNPRLATPDPAQWFHTEAFTLPPFGTFGNAGRNALTGPGLRNVNLSLLKDTKLAEAATLQFRAEFFNVFNTPNFGQPNVFFGTPGFGRVLTARDGREMQFGLKLLF